MGIPAFYRWLVVRYPLAVVDTIEEAPVVVNGVSAPIDTSRPNPNGVEFDNLYLDMNGIIHPCFHPEGLYAPKTYEEVFKAVFKYIDRIFSMVRPRKLLYMAIDGVAPRAKMNQQRARRFRAAKDAADEASGVESQRSVFESEEEKLARLEQTKKLDSNIITPGTEFMALLSSALRYYIHFRMNEDPGWRGIKVILSDANVPGEGEHKIMSYIRLQRNLPGFDPNTRHCLYGLDADLIMLALATHEIHFSILREDVRKVVRPMDKSSKFGKNSSLLNRQKESGGSKQGKVSGKDVEDYISRQKFQFLNIWVLRDYLAHEMRIPDPTVKADLERLIDDFVFMCLFIGNDFLPHVPSLEISEGAIDLLMTVYKKEFVQMGGYLTNSFEVNLERVEHFVQVVGSHESTIFRKRSQVQKERDSHFRLFSTNKFVRPPGFQNSNPRVKEIQSSVNRTFDDANTVVDKIKLGEVGWKERFYSEKFEAKIEDDRERIRRRAVLKYIEGICWVMHYYYQGVCSWQWFYPYHYAPFASDFHDLDKLEIHFTLGEPFKPFDQLMGVLPAARKLMTDTSSPIFDFYPTDFELDMNGKRFTWQAICKLPFIKESRLLSEIAKVEHTLTDEEKRRNNLGLDVLFVHMSHPLVAKIFSFCKRKKDHPKLPMAKVYRKINPNFSGGMNGYMYISDKPVQPVEIYSPIEDMEMITKNEVIFVFYKYPPFHSHIPRPPKGVILPKKSVGKQDILPPPVLWHEMSAGFGRIFSERPIPKSVSGPCLAKMAHRLVSEYYLAKRQETMGMELVDHVGADGLACQLNLKETDCLRGVDGGIENCVDGKSRKRKWGKSYGGPDNKVEEQRNGTWKKGYNGSDNKVKNQKMRFDNRPRKEIVNNQKSSFDNRPRKEIGGGPDNRVNNQKSRFDNRPRKEIGGGPDNRVNNQKSCDNGEHKVENRKIELGFDNGPRKENGGGPDNQVNNQKSCDEGEHKVKNQKNELGFDNGPRNENGDGPDNKVNNQKSCDNGEHKVENRKIELCFNNQKSCDNGEHKVENQKNELGFGNGPRKENGDGPDNKVNNQKSCDNGEHKVENQKNELGFGNGPRKENGDGPDNKVNNQKSCDNGEHKVENQKNELGFDNGPRKENGGGLDNKFNNQKSCDNGEHKVENQKNKLKNQKRRLRKKQKQSEVDSGPDNKVNNQKSCDNGEHKVENRKHEFGFDNGLRKENGGGPDNKVNNQKENVGGLDNKVNDQKENGGGPDNKVNDHKVNNQKENVGGPDNKVNDHKENGGGPDNNVNNQKSSDTGEHKVENQKNELRNQKRRLRRKRKKSEVDGGPDKKVNNQKSCDNCEHKVENQKNELGFDNEPGKENGGGPENKVDNQKSCDNGENKVENKKKRKLFRRKRKRSQVDSDPTNDAKMQKSQVSL